jgi:HD-GYP domain-containing protein (c-di-GMP phosphodiesterase class II)
MGLGANDITFMRRAALLHDVGKLSVPNTILEKPGKLTDEEWDVVKEHPRYTLEILRRIPGFGQLSDIAAAHHEKLNGSGYFRHYGADELSLEMRILTVADIYDALAAKRPYRDAMPLETVFEIMQKDAPQAIDAQCLDALRMHCSSAQGSGQDLRELAASLGTEEVRNSPQKKQEEKNENVKIIR